MITSLFHLLSSKLAHRLTLCTAFPKSQFIARLWHYLLLHLVQSSLMLQFQDLSRILCFNKRRLKVYSLLVHLISHLPQLFFILILDPLQYDCLFFITWFELNFKICKEFMVLRIQLLLVQLAFSIQFSLETKIFFPQDHQLVWIIDSMSGRWGPLERWWFITVLLKEWLLDGDWTIRVHIDLGLIGLLVIVIKDVYYLREIGLYVWRSLRRYFFTLRWLRTKLFKRFG